MVDIEAGHANNKNGNATINNNSELWRGSSYEFWKDNNSVMDRNTRMIYETINLHTDNSRDTDLRGSARLPTSTRDSRCSLLLEIPTRVQALTVSLAFSQFHYHKYNALTTQYKYMKP